MRLFEFEYDGGGWLNIKTKKYVSANGMYHTLAIFHNMEKFDLIPARMKKIPAFSKWFNLNWATKLNKKDLEELETWWFDLDIDNVPTLDNQPFDVTAKTYKSIGYSLDGDMEIIKWMNDHDWVRTARHKSKGRIETSIQANTLLQVVKAARILDKDQPIELLYFDINNLKQGMEISGKKLLHFLKYGNLNFNIRDRY